MIFNRLKKYNNNNKIKLGNNDDDDDDNKIWGCSWKINFGDLNE